MHQFSRNPFLDLSFSELSDECGRAADNLGTRVQRSPEDRADLAERVRLLLIACQRLLWVGETIPGTPEQELSRRMPGVTLESAYMSLLRSRIPEVRMEIFNRAADFAFRDRLQYERFISLPRDVTSSDEALAEGLREIEGAIRK